VQKNKENTVPVTENIENCHGGIIP
jgi:hypothetical protein